MLHKSMHLKFCNISKSKKYGYRKMLLHLFLAFCQTSQHLYSIQNPNLHCSPTADKKLALRTLTVFDSNINQSIIVFNTETSSGKSYTE